MIDLRPATLRYEEGGGGRVSYAFGIYGGFTIADGTTIEDARSGSGNDSLIGNEAANSLDGGAGNDALSGGGGGDVLIGGAGSDSLAGGGGGDIFLFDSGDSGVGAPRDVIADFLKGADRIDVGGAGASSFIGTSAFSGAAGQVRYAAMSDQTVVELDSNGDGSADFQLALTGSIQLDYSDFVGLRAAATAGADVLGGTAGADSLSALAGNDALYGLAGDDLLDGGSGNDLLVGGLGRDRMIGGSGADRFVLATAEESRIGAPDRIEDFQSGLDRIDLTGLGELIFVGKRGFSGESGEFHLVKGHGFTFVEGDLDGDRLADFRIELAGNVTPLLTDFVV